LRQVGPELGGGAVGAGLDRGVPRRAAAVVHLDQASLQRLLDLTRHRLGEVGDVRDHMTARPPGQRGVTAGRRVVKVCCQGKQYVGRRAYVLQGHSSSFFQLSSSR
jgi:hypothetical protein